MKIEIGSFVPDHLGTYRVPVVVYENDEVVGNYLFKFNEEPTTEQVEEMAKYYMDLEKQMRNGAENPG